MRHLRDYWTPARIPGVEEIFEARLPLADAAAGTAWPGQRGVATAAQGTNAPVYRHAAFSGVEAMQFAVDDSLTLDSFAARFEGNVALTLSFVFTLQNAGATESVFSFGNSADANQFFQVRTTSAGGVQIVSRGQGDGANTTSAAGVNLANDAATVLTIAHDGATFDAWVNGRVTGAAVANDYGTTVFDRGGFAVLRRTIDQQFGNLKMHAAVFALGKTPASDILRTHRYYMARLGISVA